MGAKKIAAVVGLIVVIVVALVFIARKSGIGGGPTPPQWVLEQPVERMDMNTGEAITKQLQEWEKLGQKDGIYKSPTTGQYTMVTPMTCGACGVKIPAPMPPAGTMDETSPEARTKWEATLKCPKCGKNPVGAPPR